MKGIFLAAVLWVTAGTVFGANWSVRAQPGMTAENFGGTRGIRVIEPCNDADQWALEGSGTVKTVSWASSTWCHDDGDGQVPFGYQMLELTQTNSAEVLIHKALKEPLSLSSSRDQFLIPVFVDPDSKIYSEQQWEIRLYTGYPKRTDYFCLADLALGDIRWTKGYWNLFSPIPFQNAKVVGKPDWDAINGVGIAVKPVGSQSSARMWFGPICQAANKAGKGAVILTFDDGFESVYTEAYAYLVYQGYRGVAFVSGQYISRRTNDEGAKTVSVKMLRHMQSGGWDISSHGYRHLSHRGLSLSKIRKDMEANRRWLEEQGFRSGARFFAYPYYRPDGESWRVVPDFCLMARGGGSAWEWAATCPVRNPYQIPSFEMSNSVSQDSWRHLLGEAASYRLLVVFTFHDIAAGGYYQSMNPEKFRAFIDDLSAYNLDVMTFSDLVDGY